MTWAKRTASVRSTICYKGRFILERLVIREGPSRPLIAAIVLGVVTAAFVSTALGQNASTKKRAKSAVKAQQPKQAFSPVFYLPTAMPTSYSANGPAEVFAWVEKEANRSNIAVDKFSSSDEKLAQQKSVEAKMSAVGEIPMLPKCAFKYDGDSESYTVEWDGRAFDEPTLRKPLNADNAVLRELRIETDEIKRGSYLGENAFGAKMQVEARLTRAYSLVLPGDVLHEPSGIANVKDERMPYRYREYSYGGTFKMAREAARAADANLACLFVLKLERPYTFRFSRYHAPTRDVPYDTIVEGYGFYGEMRQFIVFNKKTGETYWKRSMDE
jgi:hypothetical protein